MKDRQQQHIHPKLNVQQQNRTCHRQSGNDQAAPDGPFDLRPEGNETLRVGPGQRGSDDETRRGGGQHGGGARGKLREGDHQQQGDEGARRLRKGAKMLGELQLEDRPEHVIELVPDPSHAGDQHALADGRAVSCGRDDERQE